MAKFLQPASGQKDCGEINVSHIQSLQVICLSAVKTCGLEILSDAANLDCCMKKNPYFFVFP